MLPRTAQHTLRQLENNGSVREDCILPAELLAHFASEYADFGEGLQDIVLAVQGESRIQFVPPL